MREEAKVRGEETTVRGEGMVFINLLGVMLFNCQETDLIELFERSFFYVRKVRFGPFPNNYR